MAPKFSSITILTVLTFLLFSKSLSVLPDPEIVLPPPPPLEMTPSAPSPQEMTPPSLCPPEMAIPSKPPPSQPSSPATCPMNSLRLGVCAKLLNGLVGIRLGRQDRECCSVLSGLLALDAAACLCKAAKLNIVGIKVNTRIDVSVPIKACGMQIPAGYRCP